MKLSAREAELLTYIKKSVAENRKAPTLIEMATALGIHRSTAYTYLQRLINKGYVVRNPGVSRGLKVTYRE